MARVTSGGYFYGKAQQTRRPAVMGLLGMVSSGHYLASQAGMRMLQQAATPQTLGWPPGSASMCCSPT